VAAVLATGGPLVAQQRLSLPTPAPNSPFWGGVPTGPASVQTVTVSLADALRRALAHNLGVLTAEEAVDRADGARRLALSELLPRVEGSVTETRRKTNLKLRVPLGP
jgi:outer membrane protein TolC